MRERGTSSEKKAWELLLSCLNVLELHIPKHPLREKITEFFLAHEQTDLEDLAEWLEVQTTPRRWVIDARWAFGWVLRRISAEFGVGEWNQ